jgi:diaminohydroxyphosphoribosylaminopyrimidine deaminase/5-amino-6-(5-phosphoribosylamino)uracil reductase
MIVLDGADEGRLEAYEECGIEVLEVAAGKDGYPDSRKALSALAEKGLTRIMVEGGSALAASLMRADLVDRIAWFRAGGIMGGDGISAIAPYGVDHLEEMQRFQRVTSETLGDDVLETYRRRD